MRVRIGSAAAAVTAAVIAGASGSGTAAEAPAFKGTGTIVFACSGCPQSQSGAGLFAVGASGRSFRKLATPGLAPHTPRWSPDGRQVAFSSGFSDIWRMQAPRGKRRQLTSRSQSDRDPAWSPDGRRIVFSRQGRLYTMNSDGTGESRLTSRRRANLGAPDWSPNGRSIVFHQRGEQLYVIRADGRELRWIGLGRYPRWSPDGKWISFVRVDEGVVYVSRPDGSGERIVTQPTHLDTNVNPAWSPDGRHILFSVRYLLGPSGDAWGRELRVVSVRNGRVQRFVIPQLPPDVYAEVYGIDWTRRALSS